MAHDNAALHYPVFVKFRLSRYLYHFLQSRHRRSKVVRRRRVPPRKLAVKVFYVRQKYLHPTAKHFERLHIFVPAAVVHNGYPQLPAEQVKRLDYLRYKVRRADKVHIVRAHILHTQKRLRKLADRKLKALSLRGYLKVLTKTAPQAAPREKHRPRAFVAADARLLPHMLFSACDAHHITLAAKALAARSVNAAPARAQRAALHNIRRHFSTSQIRQGRISLPVFYPNFKLNAYLSDTFVPDR